MSNAFWASNIVIYRGLLPFLASIMTSVTMKAADNAKVPGVKPLGRGF